MIFNPIDCTDQQMVVATSDTDDSRILLEIMKRFDHYTLASSTWPMAIPEHCAIALHTM